MKKLSMWCRYDRLGASSRLRFYQFIPALQKAGLEIEAGNFFSDAYLKQLYSGNGKSKTAFFSALMRRWRELSALEDNVPALIEYELLPFMPYCFEQHFLKKRKYILNFDDAVDLRYRKLPFLRRKYPQLLANASGIIVANTELFNRFSPVNDNILKLPTVPPPPPEHPVWDKGDKLRIGWIGTPVTYQFLLEHASTLQAMYKQHPFELLAIASAGLPPVPGVPTLNVDWSTESEHAALQSCDIGIMPLSDTPFTRGKSAFKLIQYLRAGIPAIASAVGENLQVICDGKTGFCAGDAAGWLAAYRFLSVAENRRAMRADIALEAEKYSFERNAAALIDFIRQHLELEL